MRRNIDKKARALYANSMDDSSYDPGWRRAHVTLITNDEHAISEDPAYVEVIFMGNTEVFIVAEIERERGADGGMYPVVKLHVQKEHPTR